MFLLAFIFKVSDLIIKKIQGKNLISYLIIKFFIKVLIKRNGYLGCNFETVMHHLFRNTQVILFSYFKLM